MRRNPKNGAIMKHKALNTLLQGAGSVVMKYAMVLLDRAVKEEGLHSIKVIDMHDESQWEVSPNDKDKFMELAEDSLVQSGINFNMKIESPWKRIEIYFQYI